MTLHNTQDAHTHSRRRFRLSAVATALAALTLSTISLQVTAQEQQDEEVEVIDVLGARGSIQNSNNMKRESVTIVDGLSADEIGDIPALSIGEALETITGATSHRENGGATEVSVRGLGPFLGTTVINGREATNGGGNRAVNFSIFPSEMFNRIAIHKTQSAEYIEGAVSGQVHLDMRKPIDHGEQLISVNVKGSYSPAEADIDGGQDFGHRATFAYIDQFEVDDQMFGVTFGAQIRSEANPEQEYHTTSGGGRLEACELESFDADALPTDTSGRCENVSNDEIQGLIDSNDDYNSVDDIPFAYLARDHRYRQNTTGDKRHSVFGSLQWMPSEDIDIMVDFQLSERDQTEIRKDLQFSTTQEDISQLNSDPSTGLVYDSTSETQIAAYTTDFQRLEEYEGFGLNFEYTVNEDLLLTFDASYSNTERTETDYEIRLGATDDNLNGGNRDDFTLFLDVNNPGGGAGIATLLDSGDNGFEVTDPTFFNARDRLRLRAREIVRENTITAVRADARWYTGLDEVHTVKAGVRYSSLEYLTFGGDRGTAGVNYWDDDDLTPGLTADVDEETDRILANITQNCGDGSFPESNFLSDVRSANLVTNSTTGSSVNEYATFDFNCTANALLENYGGLDAVELLNGRTTGSNDVTEDTVSAYVQADYEAELGGYEVRGNFGVRIVDTSITSVGYNSPIIVTETDDGSFIVSNNSDADFDLQTAKSGYTEVLPSATLIVDLSEDVIFRSGIFRGLSRPDPNAYGNGRSITTNDEDSAYTSLDEAVNGITATGNPFLKPLTSMNYDLGVEWYVDEDTMLAVGAYYKKFKGAFETTAQTETFTINGQEVSGIVETTQTSDDSSTLTGLEFTASHSFDYLPGFLSGFGGKFSYNYADSNFEFEDQHGGDGTSLSVDENGNVQETALIGILEPAGLFGLSRHVSATQLYWQQDDFSISAIYKTRSQYFQQYTRDTQGRVRYTAPNQTLDLRLKYKLTDNISVSLEGTNLTNEPRTDYRGVDGNVLQSLSYGPRYYLGISAKL
ncbi:TonB-dependent receptor [Glaciecola sp. 2405UD65-10]|uniref:TonB-dependent receptor n=1 Tax=Glaciecola sp. 2405UD65-10 TaxID=3397244 RepID=UPI003B5B8F81